MGRHGKRRYCERNQLLFNLSKKIKNLRRKSIPRFSIKILLSVLKLLMKWMVNEYKVDLY